MERELARRTVSQSTLEVVLWWDDTTNKTAVTIADNAIQPPYFDRIDVPENIRALDVYHHPFAYLADQALKNTELSYGMGE